MKISSYFVKKYEKLMQMRELPPLVDRVQVVREIYELESRF